MAVGVLLGSYFGAKIAIYLPKEGLKLVFGFVLIYVAGYTVFGKEHLTRSVLLAAGLVLVAVLAFGVTKWVDAAERGDQGEAPAARPEESNPTAPGAR